MGLAKGALGRGVLAGRPPGIVIGGRREQPRAQQWEQRLVLKMGVPGVGALVEYYAATGHPQEILAVLEQASGRYAASTRCWQRPRQRPRREAQAEPAVHCRPLPSSASLGDGQGRA